MYCNRFSLILGSMYTAYLHIKMDYVFYCDDNEIELLATDTVLICYKNLFLHALMMFYIKRFELCLYLYANWYINKSILFHFIGL